MTQEMDPSRLKYPLNDESAGDFEYAKVRFTYHKPKPDQPPRYEELRDFAREFAEKILTRCPPSLERNRALERLDEVVMWANASIARNE